MTLSKPVKILIGALTAFGVLFPFLVMPIFFMLFMVTTGFPFLEPQSVPNPNEMDAMIPIMLLIYPLMMCFTIVQFGLQIFYIVHIVKNRILGDTPKVLYTLGTFFMPFIAMPVYFIASLWNYEPQDFQIPSS